MCGAALAQQTVIPRQDGTERLQPPEPPRRPPDISLPQAEPSAPPPGAEDVRIALRDIVVDGATVYTAADLRGVYAGELGITVTLARLFEIAAAIEARYRADGYVLSRVIVPAQTIEDGVFRLRAIEGYVSAVRIEGEVGAVQALIESYVRKITEHRPVRLADIERYLLLVNDIPGITARSVPRPGAEVGASELVVVVQRKPVDGFAFIDNRGSRLLGRTNFGIGGALNSFTRFGEQLEGVFFAAPFEQDVEQVSYEQRIGSEGLSAKVAATFGHATPGERLEDLDIEADTLFLNAEFRYPVVRTRPMSLWVLGGFDYIDSDTDVIRRPFSEDFLRVVYAGARLEFRDGWMGANLADLRVRRGLDIFGASDEGDPDNSRPTGSGEFTLISGEISRLQGLFGNFSLFGKVGAQYAFDDLLAGEEFSIGGLTFGRGYDPAELTGEHGFGATIELRYLEPQVLFARNVELYWFYDWAAVWNRDLGDQRDSLSSAGAGVRLDFTDWLSGNLEGAKPLTKPLANRFDGKMPLRIYGSLVARF